MFEKLLAESLLLFLCQDLHRFLSVLSKRPGEMGGCCNQQEDLFSYKSNKISAVAKTITKTLLAEATSGANQNNNT